MVETPSVNSPEALLECLQRVRAAQTIYSTFPQEKVDAIFRAAAMAANQQRIPLAKMAVEETGMGIVEDKVIKNHYASEYIYNAYKNTKTCDIISRDPAYGTMQVAEPLGVVAAVIPTTNPTSTAIFKILITLKTRNGIIISPHPRAKQATIAAAKIVAEAAYKAGAPEGLIACIDQPSLALTNMLMKEADITLATGGPGMVSAAYSSGKPALGVGAGNTPAIIDDSADVVMAVNSIIHSKTFDNGMICASEQSVIVLDSIYDKVKAEFLARGCYFLSPEETDLVRKTIIINGALNAKIVGQSAYKIAELSGVTVPEDAKILIGEVESVDISEEFAHEKLSPVLAMYHAKDFDEAVSKAERLIFPRYLEFLAGGMPQAEFDEMRRLVRSVDFRKDYSIVYLNRLTTLWLEKNWKSLMEFYNEEVFELPDAKVRLNLDVLLRYFAKEAPDDVKEQMRAYVEKCLQNPDPKAENGYKNLLKSI